MAVANDKELLQCLAFAFFAKHPHSPTGDHQTLWEDVFMAEYVQKKLVLSSGQTIKAGTRLTKELLKAINSDKTEYDETIFTRKETDVAAVIKKEYGKWLSQKFPYAEIVNLFAPVFTKNETTKKFTATYDPKVRIIYDVTKNVYQSPSLMGKWSDYLFLDQNDDITQSIKDTPLKRIHKLFKMRGRHEILSPVDMFCIRRGSVNRIVKDFEDNITNASDEEILSNMSYGKMGKNTYRTIHNKYFQKQDCIGVSLKLPTTISGSKNIKIIGTTVADTSLKDLLDPYGKLLGQMLQDNTDIDDMISKVITINFSEFRIDSSLSSWEYPVTFNYDKVLDSETREPLFKTKLKFGLLTWADVGFNGQWIVGDNQRTTWVSGMGIGPSEKMFFRYDEYRQIIEEIMKIRLSVFNGLFPKNRVPAKHSGEYQAAITELSQKKILPISQIKNVDKFLKLMDPSERSMNEFRFLVTKFLTRNMKTNLTSIGKYVDNHFQASQLAYFLFRGIGTDRKTLLLKKRIFLSLYGMLTKSGYKIFEKGATGKTEMKNYIMRQLMKGKTQVEAYYNAAPYILLS